VIAHGAGMNRRNQIIIRAKLLLTTDTLMIILNTK
jgi:hypothetical protein